MFSKLQPEHRLEFGDLLMSQKLGVVHAEVRVVVRVHMRGVLLLGQSVLDFKVGGTDPREGHPVVVAFIEVLEVDVVAVGILISGFGGVIIYN